MATADLVAGTLAGAAQLLVGACDCRAVLQPCLPGHACLPAGAWPHGPHVPAPAPAGHPFDTCKVMMQIKPGLSPMEAVRGVVAAQGVLGMYKGMGAPLATVAAFNAVLFSTRGYTERALSPDGAPLTAWQAVIAGGVAGVPVSLMAAPTELLKCRLQAQKSKPPPGAVYTAADVRAGRALYRGPAQVAQAIVRYEGALQLFRGLSPTLLREVPGNAGGLWK